MHYLIDGHNLIARTPGLSLADPDDEAKLSALLRRWAAADPRRKVTVIFDAGLKPTRLMSLKLCGCVTPTSPITSQMPAAISIQSSDINSLMSGAVLSDA